MPTPDPSAPVFDLAISGRFFTAGGARLTIIETSEFSLYKRFLDREPIVQDILAQRRDLGFNFGRVWLCNKSVVGMRDGQGDAGIHPNQYQEFYTRLPEFCDLYEQHGMAVELTVFTSCGGIRTVPGAHGLMPSKDEQQAHYDRTAAAVRNFRHVILEEVNEGDQWDNAPWPDLQRPTGGILSLGSNGSDSIPPGHDAPRDYELYHILGGEWQRKVGHNAMEWADQSGKPCWTNETQRYPDNEQSLTRAYDAAAGGALLAAGSCFHSQAGKYSRLFTGIELAAAQQWVAGARSVPLEFQAGDYQRHDDRNSATVIRSYSRTLGDGRAHFVDIRA